MYCTEYSNNDTSDSVHFPTSDGDCQHSAHHSFDLFKNAVQARKRFPIRLIVGSQTRCTPGQRNPMLIAAHHRRDLFFKNVVGKFGQTSFMLNGLTGLEQSAKARALSRISAFRSMVVLGCEIRASPQEALKGTDLLAPCVSNR